MRVAALVLLLVPALLPPAALAKPGPSPDLVVIVNPASSIRSLTPNQVIDIFMGRFRQLPSGTAALPIDLADSADRRQFYQRLIHWTLSEVDSYWARLVFSGQANPPYRAPSTRAAIDLVARNRGAIAYIDRSAVNKQVKVVLDLGKP